MNELQLVITLKPGAGVQVHGPITDKVLCYGLLECAKDAVRDFVAKGGAAGKGLLVPTITLPANGGRG